MTSHTIPAAAIPKPQQSLAAWAVTQFLRCIWGILYIVVVGLVIDIVKGRFSGRAFIAGSLFLMAGITATTMAIQVDPNRFGDNAVVLTWSAALAVCFVTGGIIGRLSRRVGYWESYATALLTIAVAYVHLRWGFHHLIARFSDHPSYLDLVGAIQPGERLLGDLWQGLLGLGLGIGFQLMVFAGSLVFLIYGDDGVRDASFSYEVGIALRQLRQQRHGLVSATALVAITGVAVGVAALVAVTAVMSGYQSDIQSRILSTNAHLVVQKYGVDFTEYEKVAETVSSVPEVIATTPFVFNEASFSHGDRGFGVLLKGVVPETAGNVTDVTRNLCERVDNGSCVPFAKADESRFVTMLRPDADRIPKIIVGIELYKRQELALGDLVTLTTPVSLTSIRGTAPKRMQFRVAGVFRSGMHEFDSRLTYLELSASQELLGLGKSVSGVELRLTDAERVEAISTKVLRAVGRYPYRTLDWRELNQGIFRALFLQKLAFYIILAMIIVVASFNIASTLFMTVIEKSREIGVMKSMGARDSSIMKIFVLEGWIVGLIGTACGLALGVGVAVALSQLELQIAADVYMVESLTVRLRPLEMCLTAAAAFVISHLATLQPAMRAAAQRPVDAMRYD